MNQSTENALRAVLMDATEELDDNQDRYQQVAARFRRRQRRRLSGAAAAAVLLVTGGAVTLVGGLGRTPEPDPTAPLVDCPPRATAAPAPPAGGPSAGAPQPGPLVPEGPVAARVCGLMDSFQPSRYIEVTLDQGLDRLVTLLNSLENTPPDPDCLRSRTNALTIPWYHVVFAYPDGDRVTALIGVPDCTVWVGDDLRAAVPHSFFGESLELVYELAEAQRWADAPATPPEPACPAPTTAFNYLAYLADPAPDPPRFDAYLILPEQSVPYRAVAVTVCRYSTTDPRTARLVTSAVVTGDRAERARELVNAQSPDRDERKSCEPTAGSFDVLVFADAAGGGYEVRLGRGECRLFHSAADLSGEPDPALQQWVDDVLGGPPPD